MKKKKMKKFDVNKPILLIKIGNDNYPADDDALSNMDLAVQEINLNKKYNILITHHAVNIQFVDPKNITKIDDLIITKVKDLEKLKSPLIVNKKNKKDKK